MGIVSDQEPSPSQIIIDYVLGYIRYLFLSQTIFWTLSLVVINIAIIGVIASFAIYGSPYYPLSSEHSVADPLTEIMSMSNVLVLVVLPILAYIRERIYGKKPVEPTLIGEINSVFRTYKTCFIISLLIGAVGVVLLVVNSLRTSHDFIPAASFGLLMFICLLLVQSFIIVLVGVMYLLAEWTGKLQEKRITATDLTNFISSSEICKIESNLDKKTAIERLSETINSHFIGNGEGNVYEITGLKSRRFQMYTIVVEVVRTPHGSLIRLKRRYLISPLIIILNILFSRGYSRMDTGEFYAEGILKELFKKDKQH